MPNPYDFVPFAEVKRKNFKGLTKHNTLASALTGEIACTLTTKSFFSIKDIFEKAYHKTGIFIPGSSIRGMIRATMEALYGGCGFRIDRSYHYERIPRTQKIYYNVENCFFNDGKYASLNENEKSDDLSKYANCSARIDALYKENKQYDNVEICEICSLFGFISESGLSFKSRIIFADSDLVTTELIPIQLPRPDTPRVYRRSFYFKNPASLDPMYEKIDRKTSEKTRNYPGGEYNGRKFYLHGILSSGDEPPVFAVEPETNFNFSISFNNIDESELGMLLFALNLDDGMYHKLGYGKPVGLGSVKIKINEIKYADKSRYETFECFKQNKTEKGKEIEARINEFLNKSYFKNGGLEQKLLESPHFKKLKQIWSSSGIDQELIYPDLKRFFGKKEFIDTTLSTYNKLLVKGVFPKPKTIPQQVKKDKTSVQLTKKEPISKKPEVKSKREEENVLKLKISNLNKNICYVEYEEKEIKVASFIEDAVVGKLLKGFIKHKKDGSVQFIPKKKE